MSSVIYAKCHKIGIYAGSHSAKCRYADCYYAESRYGDCDYAECLYAECHLC